MKLKFIFIICIFVSALIIVFEWPSTQTTRNPTPNASNTPKATAESRDLPAPATPDSPPTPQLDPAEQGQTPDYAALRNLIIQGYGKGAAKGNDAMETYLKTWNPMGRSVQELKDNFGRPSREDVNSITYIFDPGYGGWIFRFVLHEGKVIELTRPPSE